MGIIIRNTAKDLMKFYPDDVATWCRQMAMAVLMLIGGMELEFEGRGGVMIAMTFFPLVFEVLGFAIAGCTIMKMNLTFAITVGMVLGAVSPGVLIPILLKLKDEGYGMKKGIPYLVIGAASFDDIVAITGFMVAATFGYNEFDPKPKHIKVIIGRLFMEVFIGLFSGMILGGIMWFLKNCHKYIKFVASSIGVMGLVAIHYFFHLMAGEFLCAIIFGYMCLRVWGHDAKPQHEVEMLWGVATPFLFGTIGACLDFDKINKSVLGDTIGCIMIALVFRTVSAYASVYESQYNWKEKAFCAIAWLPKGSVNAVVGGMVLDHANKMTVDNLEQAKNKATVKHYGEISLTAALISILITAPLGAVLTVLCGEHWLERETQEEAKEREQIEKEVFGEEEVEKQKKKEEELRGATSGKTLGISPAMMVARSTSYRSVRSKRSGNYSKEDKKANIDKLNE